MSCKICDTKNNKIFSSTILNKHKVDYFYCKNCGFLQTEEPYWLKEAYKDSINISDTGYMQRNLSLSKKITVLLALMFDKNANFLDYAGGYGVFVRLMRDIGFDFVWDDKYSKNLFAHGSEYKMGRVDAITTFESFEHFVDPIQEIEKMLNISKTIIFSTEFLPNPTPNPKDWWYYGLDHGQHISFYSTKTMEFIARKYDLSFYSFGGIHILSEKRVPKYTKYLLKFTRFGLHNIFAKRYTSKIWEDHLKTKG